MGIFSRLFSSLKKSKEIRRLQEQISPPLQASDDIAAWARARMAEGNSKRDRALEEYLTLCESDENIAQILARHQINRNDLKNMYEKINSYAPGWTKDHHIALSSIAYPEPLIYIIDSERIGTNWGDIAWRLKAYWDGSISQGTLIKYIGR
jgi:hypothetical protein